MALGFALILGITASFGSLIQWRFFIPGNFFSKRGIALIIGTMRPCFGDWAFLALAGRARERDQADAGARSGFTVGLVDLHLLGHFSSMMNFSFVFGDERGCMPCSPEQSIRDGRQSDLGTYRDRRFCIEFPVLRVSPK